MGFDSEFDSCVGKIFSSRRKGQSIPVYLPGKSHGQRSLVGYSLKDCKEWDTAEDSAFHSLKIHLLLKKWLPFEWLVLRAHWALCHRIGWGVRTPSSSPGHRNPLCGFSVETNGHESGLQVWRVGFDLALPAARDKSLGRLFSLF